MSGGDFFDNGVFDTDNFLYGVSFESRRRNNNKVARASDGT